MRLSFNLSNVTTAQKDGGNDDRRTGEALNTVNMGKVFSTVNLHSTDTKKKPLSLFKGEGYKLYTTSGNGTAICYFSGYVQNCILTCYAYCT